MSKSKGQWFGAGREVLIQRLLEYEMGLHDHQDAWQKIEDSLPRSDRVKRHIKRLFRDYFAEKDSIDNWLDRSLKSKSFMAFSELEKIILRLAALETRHYASKLGMPIIVDSWADISKRYVDAGFARLVHAVMGAAFEEYRHDVESP